MYLMDFLDIAINIKILTNKLICILLFMLGWSSCDVFLCCRRLNKKALRITKIYLLPVMLRAFDFSRNLAIILHVPAWETLPGLVCLFIPYRLVSPEKHALAKTTIMFLNKLGFLDHFHLSRTTVFTLTLL